MTEFSNVLTVTRLCQISQRNANCGHKIFKEDYVYVGGEIVDKGQYFKVLSQMASSWLPTVQYSKNLQVFFPLLISDNIQF